jgi:hypothetical protein
MKSKSSPRARRRPRGWVCTGPKTLPLIPLMTLIYTDLIGQRGNHKRHAEHQGVATEGHREIACAHQDQSMQMEACAIRPGLLTLFP